jgi:nucleoside-triphosphatase THEP1
MEYRHIVVTGEVGSGKTTMLYALCSRLDSAGYSIGGMIQVLPLPHEQQSDKVLSDQGTGEIKLLMSMVPNTGWPRYGKYYYDPEAFEWASQRIAQFMPTSDYIIIDEIGPIELSGGGLYEIYRSLLQSFSGTVITVIRKSLLEEVLEYFGIPKERTIVLRSDAPLEEELGKVIH